MVTLKTAIADALLVLSLSSAQAQNSTQPDTYPYPTPDRYTYTGPSSAPPDRSAGPTGTASTFMPNYDVGRFCEGNPYHQSVAWCLDFQYQSRHLAAAEWLTVSSAVRVECIANNPTADYQLLYSCVDAHINDSKVQPNITGNETHEQ